MVTDPWLLTGLLALSIALTLFTDWLASGRQRPSIPCSISSSDIIAVGASLLWIMLIFFAGIVSSRYIERIDYTAIGYLSFAVTAGILSWFRAVLFRRMREQSEQSTTAPTSQRSNSFVRITNYLLFGIFSYLIGMWALQRPAEPVLLIPLCLGALIPDLDSQHSEIGRLLPQVSGRLEARFGRRQGWHSFAVNALMAAVTSPLILLVGVQAWVLVSLGFLSHILFDLLTPQGAMLFWPVRRTRYSLVGGPRHVRDLSRSYSTLVVLSLLSLVLLLLVGIGPRPAAPPPAPSYDQTLERYYSMRGKNLVYAYIEGSWQTSGRRLSGTFEILNATGDSYIMLDRYSGKVFSAGRGADDNLYLHRISLQTGPSALVKPVEVQLQDQLLADALPVMYEMQREPGLQHTYVSGDIVLAPTSDPASPSLQQDYAQTSLRRIQAHEPGHYSLHYVTAGDLIALANLPVETADLIVVATYASPPNGPTATPLPTVTTRSVP
jgi:membrane-bound metal-dependent hydrolase YbcI (DUF457 family)